MKIQRRPFYGARGASELQLTLTLIYEVKTIGEQAGSRVAGLKLLDHIDLGSVSAGSVSEQQNISNEFVASPEVAPLGPEAAGTRVNQGAGRDHWGNGWA